LPTLHSSQAQQTQFVLDNQVHTDIERNQIVHIDM
jgi:hypothetical protein